MVLEKMVVDFRMVWVYVIFLMPRGARIGISVVFGHNIIQWYHGIPQL
jgi:hypothetical protein